jgi:hypothetical protein
MKKEFTVIYNHIFTCDKNYSFGNNYKKNKGFSLTELTLALGVIGLFITIITIATIRGQTTLLAFSSDKIIVSELENYSKIIASKPFIQLYNKEIEYPDSEKCANESSTCTTIFNKTFKINWSIEHVSENDSDSETIDYVIIKGSVNWDDANFEHEEIVYAPTVNWRPDYGVLQINLDNPADLSLSEIYLINYQTGEPVASSELIQNNLSYISAPLESCGEESQGCVIALESNGSSKSGNITLDANSATLPIKISQDKIKTISPTISNISKISLQLYAKNGAGELKSADKLNSICFYLTFHDGVAKRYLPYCNNTFEDKIEIESYTPDKNKPWNKLSISSNYEYTLTTDYKDNSCPNISGMVSVSNGSWQNISTCLDWTWGKPFYISDGIDINNFDDYKFNLLPGINNYTLTWTPDNNSPASGGNYMQPLWSKPRDTLNILNPITCTSNDNNCNSRYKAGPTLIAPRSGLYQLPSLTVPMNSGYDFTLIIKDYDDINNDSINSVYLQDTDLGSGSINKFTSTIINGTSTIVETPLNDNDIIGTSSNGYYSIPLRLYTSNKPLQSFTIKMIGKNDISYEKIYLSAIPSTVKILPESASFKQGDESYIKVLAINSHGNPSSNVMLTGILDSNITFNSALTNNDGYALVPIKINNAPSAKKTIAIAHDNILGYKDIYINQNPGSILSTYSDSNPASIPQGGNKSIAFTVLDRSGSPISGTGISIRAFKNNNFTSDISIKNNNCITNSLGICSVIVNANKSAKSGTYQLYAKSENISNIIPIEITKKVNNIISPISTIIQGGSGLIEVKVLDGAGEPIESILTTATSPGFTFQSDSTNSSGIATISYSAPLNITKGLTEVTFSADGINKKGYIRVTQKVSSVISSPIDINQGAAVRSSIKILDSNDEPITGIILTATSSENIKLSFEPSFIDGKSYFEVTAPNSILPGSYLVNLTYDNKLLDILTIRVRRGIGSITASGTIRENQGSIIYITIKDFDNSPISNREIKISSTSNAVILGTLTNTQTAQPINLKTSADGTAELKVFGKTGIAKAPIKLVVESSGAKYYIFVEDVE